MSEIVHIAGQAVQIGPLVRQRCSWCGAVLEDVDLRTLAVMKSDEKEPDPEAPFGGLPMWGPGELIAQDGNARWEVEHNDGDQIPENCCGNLDPEVTGA